MLRQDGDFSNHRVPGWRAMAKNIHLRADDPTGETRPARIRKQAKKLEAARRSANRNSRPSFGKGISRTLLLAGPCPAHDRPEFLLSLPIRVSIAVLLRKRDALARRRAMKFDYSGHARLICAASRGTESSRVHTRATAMPNQLKPLHSATRETANQ